MPITSSYGFPGSATYSQDLGSLDQIMSTLPDNIINQISAKNVRDSAFTMYNIIQSAIAANLSQVTAVGNTTSRPIFVGGLQVSGTSSFSKNVNITSTLSDLTGKTGPNGYILSATSGGLIWTAPVNTLNNLSQVTVVGNTTSLPISIGGLQVNGTSSFSNNINIISTISDSTGKTGSNGYILSATGGGVVWTAPINTVNNLSQVTTIGNTTSSPIFIGGLQVNGTSSFSSNVNIKSTLSDSTGKTGPNGYILSASGGGVIWTQILTNLSQITSVGNTTSLPIFVGGLQVSGTSSFSSNINIISTISDINGKTGPNGYILSATGGGIIWTQPQVNLSQITNIGNTTSLPIFIGGLQVNGTSSFF